MCRVGPLAVVLFLLLPALGCGAKQSDLRVTTLSVPCQPRLCLVVYGITEDRLAFVVFESGPGSDAGLKSSVKTTVDSQRTTAELIRPDGTTVRLPTATPLMEITDGHYTESNRRVSLQELQAFLASQPDAYTIEKLLQFVDGRGQE